MDFFALRLSDVPCFRVFTSLGNIDMQFFNRDIVRLFALILSSIFVFIV